MKVTVTYEEGSGSVSITKGATDFTWRFDNSRLSELTTFAEVLYTAGWPESDEVPEAPRWPSVEESANG